MLDDQHIERVAEDDYTAFVELHHALYERLFYYVYQMVKNKEVSEDILQETFIKYWENRKSFSSFLSVKVYMYTVSRNMVIHHFRDNETHHRILEKMEYEPILTEDHLLITSEICAMVQQAIAALPAQTRRVIELSIEDRKVSEIAEELHISPNTVKTLKKNAYQTLREQLSHLKGLLPFIFG